jgi:hypothetical protein
MIKAEDLRIGDLVIVNENCSLEQGTIGKVSEVRSTPLYKENEGSIGLKPISNDRWPYGVLCRNIDPIPLTPEILEKNGWKKRTEGWYFMMISKYMYLSVEFGYENGIRVFLKRTTDGLYVKLNVANNVHELQHILWALGLDAELKV